MPDSLEQSPGVYVRTGEYEPHELDMLWSGSKHFSKEDRSPVIFTVVGVVIGIIITTAIFFLFNNKPQITTGENELTVPIVDETELVPKVPDPNAQPTPEAAPAETTASSSAPASNQGSRTYTVKSGDTLEAIARRFYGSGTPQMIHKIQRANNITNPDRLQLGQKLVIPPRNY